MQRKGQQLWPLPLSTPPPCHTENSLRAETMSPWRVGVGWGPGQFLPFSVPGLSRMGDTSLHRLPVPPQALPGHTAYLVGEEPVPLVLLGSRAIHPLEGRVLDEDGQCSEDEGRKQVQVDVVAGAVQVSARERTGPSGKTALDPRLSG